ncbi:TVP38/TMEM64 family protein [Photobacterium ganghwense]|uniref:TVP38/TMEM64 family protein n=1 Tax=Photobacterium ganghwense TaxID=320778 RepID=UPI001C2D7B6D|nr:VTT domain-containing protein [Photobacterium ganghwense]MBV1841927.1 VTT domain-containing protein [Photobacterium ganghwense]
MTVMKPLLTCSVFLVLIAGINTPVFAHMTDKLWLNNYVLTNGLSGHLAIFSISFLFVGLGGPRQVVAALNGYLYGIVFGLQIALLTCIFAACVNYFVANTLLSQTLRRTFPKKMNQFQQFVRQTPFLKILMLRLFPVGNNVLTNLLSGSIGVPFKPFITASLLGYIPQTLIFCLIGSGISAANDAMIYASILLTLISFILTGVIYRDHIRQRIAPLKMENHS